MIIKIVAIRFDETADVKNIPFHRWIFIHEPGYWWRACQHQVTDSYSSEPILRIAYVWYQATMIVDGYNEKPIVSFKESIASAGNKN